METRQITSTLKSLIGHLKLNTKTEQRHFNQLARLLSKSIFEEDIPMAAARADSMERSDLFSDETIAEPQRKAISTILKNRTGKNAETTYRVFKREVPVQEQLIYQSVADWAAGSSVEHRLGPFTRVDGRQLWYDFYPVEKLIALYMQGIQGPVLLFKVNGRRESLLQPGRPRISLSKTYRLGKGSIWIRSGCLAPNAPSAAYTGLKISSGSITLNVAPQQINNQLTVPAGTVIKVQLHLEQPEAGEVDHTSPFGADARKIELQLPQLFEFHFSASQKTIDKAGDASWKLYGQHLRFEWSNAGQAVYNPEIRRILLPFTASEQELLIRENAAGFNLLSGSAAISKSSWALPVANIDIAAPTVAAGIGELFVQCKDGLTDNWTGLNGNGFALKTPAFLVGPGQLLLIDLTTGNPHASHDLTLWKAGHGSQNAVVQLTFSAIAPFYYVSNASGHELIMTSAGADFQIDRPVRVNGQPPVVQAANATLIISASAASKLIYLFDYNLIADAEQPQQMALALTNALFKVSQPNGCLLFGTLNDDFNTAAPGFLFITFGLLAYIPTLPDPYAANLGILKRQIRGRTASRFDSNSLAAAQQPLTAWLVCRITWEAGAAATSGADPGPGSTSGADAEPVEVSFHFAPLDNQFAGISMAVSSASPEPANNESLPDFAAPAETRMAMSTSHSPALPDYNAEWDKETNRYKRDLFALLDVSTNADLFGISFDLLTRRDFRISTATDTATGEASASFFPVQVRGMDVVSAGTNVKAFMLPQISWEPVSNLSPPAPPPDGPLPGDPAGGFNYYPNDGGPSHILNNSREPVVLTPLALTSFLLNQRRAGGDFKAFSFVTLPFGLKAAALLTENYVYNNISRPGGDLSEVGVDFENNLRSGLQLTMDAGVPLREGDSDMFMGTTVQINNILDLAGNATGNSTLGGSVTRIFNREFFYDSNYPFELFKQRGVPVTRMDLSGYGASMFSNWLNTKAAIAETSQAKFDVFVGRCSHEIIQVKSILYPWGIKVVRTVTLFRVGSGYVYRFDSGWRAESDGKFDFRYFVYENNPNFPGGSPENPEPQLIAVERSAEFEIHPGLVRALYNVSNITETSQVQPFTDNIIFEESVNEQGEVITTPKNYDIELQPVYFDADVDLEGLVSGMTTKLTADGEKEVVPSSRILGFVQLGPRGFPLNNAALKLLVARQHTIGGTIDCEVDLAGSTQKMRLSRFDFSNSFGPGGSEPVFCVAARGNVLLPKDGSWSMIKHERETGDVSPVPAGLSIPVIRQGQVVKDGDTVKIDTPAAGVLTRIAEPTELLRQPAGNTVNYGFLQSTDTQKALFLTPAFRKDTKKLLSKTPPLFVDAFRIVNSKGIFPNIGTADDLTGETLGEAILMKKNGAFPFDTNSLKDLGKDVFDLMDIQDTINGVKQQGLQLLHNPEEVFDLPTEFELIDLGDGNFRIYIEYDKKDKAGNVEDGGSLEFDINSVAESWKSKMNNIGLVLDLGGIKRLMTIRGNWDSENGKEAAYPKPDLKFAPELDPLVDLLEILQSLQDGNYGEAVQNGLKLAMSNKAGSWEYKFEASKEIPVLRFPFPDAVYNDPNTPFKLEAGLKIGAYFNAALKVTTDANELLPSAGGLLGFYARLSVMCVSVSAATIYAIGQANVDIAADTKIGPSLRMKFGFGAQIVVGLPVAGNVSVLFVVGAEIFVASGVVEVSAFLLFQGHAEILGGIVSITIRIEAKGTYSKKQIGGGSRTDLQCQVTFGLDISIAFVINISFTESWQEQRQIA